MLRHYPLLQEITLLPDSGENNGPGCLGPILSWGMADGGEKEYSHVFKPLNGVDPPSLPERYTSCGIRTPYQIKVRSTYPRESVP